MENNIKNNGTHKQQNKRNGTNQFKTIIVIIGTSQERQDKQ